MGFAQLFDIAVNPQASIVHKGQWLEGKWEWSFQWSRDLREAEAELRNALHNLLHCTVPDGALEDSWQWGNSGAAGYSVKNAYCIFTGDSRNGLLTVDYLKKRGIIPER
ncbi:hypothetical protein Ancab_011031 [Ancistrocladus abbreviatus]